MTYWRQSVGSAAVVPIYVQYSGACALACRMHMTSFVTKNVDGNRPASVVVFCSVLCSAVPANPPRCWQRSVVLLCTALVYSV